MNNYEGATAGTVNYASTYTVFATNSSINACTDTDGDGVRDVVDIDDDNDGVLDAVESPSCFYSANEWNAIDKRPYVTVSSQLNTLLPNNNFGSLLDNVSATAAVQFSTATAQAQLNREIFRVEFDRRTQLTDWYIQKTSATQILGGNVMLQGSNDATTWTNLWTAAANPANATNVTVNGGVALTNSNRFTVTTNAGAYKFYRIFGAAAANVLAGIASEMYFDLNTANYQASFYPKPIACTSSADNDNLPNHLDPDSDNDGCNDAIEGAGFPLGTTVPVAGTDNANYGANGFINTRETGTESGIFNGAYTYRRALLSIISSCTDTDGDGIANINDLDDDNDGVLDEVECPITTCSPENVVTNGGFEALTGGFYTNANYPGWQTTATDNQIEIWNGGTPPAAEGLRFAELNAYQMSSLFNKLCIAPGSVFKWSIKHRGRSGVDVADVQFGATVAGATTVQRMSTGATAWVTYEGTYTVPAGQTETFFVIKSVSSTGGAAWGNFIDDFKIEMVALASEVTSTCDTDNDGIPNTLDPDSDGDGCNDAIEGAGYPLGTAVPVAGSGNANYGANGFVNTRETAAESGLFNGMYTYNYATTNVINACTDTDGDGVRDVNDIDDDNDGVVDSEECGCAKAGTTAAVIAPSAIVTIPTNKFGAVTTSSRAFDGSGLSATPTTEASLSSITHSSPSLITNAAYTNDGAGMSDDWKITLPSPTDVKGMALWIPGSNAYGGGDAPFKKFKVSWADCTGAARSQIVDLGTPSPNAKMVYFNEPILQNLH